MVRSATLNKYESPVSFHLDDVNKKATKNKKTHTKKKKNVFEWNTKQLDEGVPSGDGDSRPPRKL